MEKEQIKNKVREEIRLLFNEAYSGIHCPDMNSSRIDFWVEKALNIYDREMFYDERNNAKKRRDKK